MVRIKNVIGDIKTGKQGDFIYQKVHGKQVLRQGFNRKNEESPLQKAQRDRFRAASAWIKTLTGVEKSYLKKIYNETHQSWTPGQPSTWYNFCKWIYLKNPVFTITDPLTGKYLIKHPAVMSVTELNFDYEVLYKVDDLCSLSSLELLEVYEHTPSSECKQIVVTTLPGSVFSYNMSITPIIHSYVSSFTASSNGAGVLINRPVPLAITYVPDIMRSDFGDIRFSLADGTPLDYYIESKTDGVICNFKIMVPVIPESPDNVAIYISCGDPEAVTTANPDGSSFASSVHLDWLGGILDPWTVEWGDIGIDTTIYGHNALRSVALYGAYEGRASTPSNKAYGIWKARFCLERVAVCFCSFMFIVDGSDFNSPSYSVRYHINSPTTAIVSLRYNESVILDSKEVETAINEPHIFEISRDMTGNFIVKLDDVPVLSATDNNITSSVEAWLRVWSDGWYIPVNWDYIDLPGYSDSDVLVSDIDSFSAVSGNDIVDHFFDTRCFDF